MNNLPVHSILIQMPPGYPCLRLNIPSAVFHSQLQQEKASGKFHQHFQYRLFRLLSYDEISFEQ